MVASHPHYSSGYKKAVVDYWTENDEGGSLGALARRFKIKGGAKTVKRWIDGFDGSEQSLVERSRSGRPRILTCKESYQTILFPILSSNRSSTAISYTSLIPSVLHQTGKSISLRSIQRYGRRRGIKSKSTLKRTSRERN